MSTTAEYLAERFHEAYERLASTYQDDTLGKSRTAWTDVPDRDKKLMIATCQDLLDKKVITVL